ncbi:hypothetical protein [Falsibacillus albus]|uniref:Uncharacterized protein n=1 Tax=Falsibacillus albus TaxID=2478915 RepID=A0A3L7K4V9_9BACI|nr:hypothetical protein [Falsibacillus albus]RLQ97294.1 hypothetical protein D9X91_03855 [Falsibacillus albus]
MSGVIFCFYAISAVLFFGTFHYLIAIKRPGIYPPKNLMKKRAGVLGAGGIIVLILGLLLSLIVN